MQSYRFGHYWMIAFDSELIGLGHRNGANVLPEHLRNKPCLLVYIPNGEEPPGGCEFHFKPGDIVYVMFDYYNPRRFRSPQRVPLIATVGNNVGVAYYPSLDHIRIW